MESEARCASGSETNAKRQSNGTLSHLYPSVAQESAVSIACVRLLKRGLALAQTPKAPSTCTQAPYHFAIGISSANESNAPIFTSPACSNTNVGESGASLSFSSSAVGISRP